LAQLPWILYLIGPMESVFVFLII